MITDSSKILTLVSSKTYADIAEFEARFEGYTLLHWRALGVEDKWVT